MSIPTFLINHEDINIRIIGLSESISSSNYSKNELKQIDLNVIADIIYDMVANEKLNTLSLMIASDLCTHQIIKVSRDSALINQKLILSDPHNIVVYINSLSRAFINNDLAEIDSLVHRMEKSQYAKNYSVTSEKFDSVIKQYVKDNPFYKEKIDFELEFFKTFNPFSQEKNKKIKTRSR